MALSVLQVAYPFAAVGPDAVGGAEQLLSLLDAALVRRAHRSIVIACEGAITAGRLVAVPGSGPVLDDAEWWRAHASHRAAIRAVLEANDVDLVHMHGVDFASYLPPPGVPVLATLHLPPSFYRPEALRPGRPETFLNCVSRSQRASCPAGAPVVAHIENGVRLDLFQMRESKDDFVLALGRVCPEKGFHLALDAARRAGVGLLLAGGVFPYPAHEGYFQAEIAPRLDGRRRFVGPVGGAWKHALLARARCLLVPSLAPETSSLVAMEALASGTPVVARRVGALPEIVEDGVTGFLVDSVEEMADAISRTRALRPRDCRRAAEERFSADVVVDRYCRLYSELANGGSGRGPARRSPAGALRVEEVESVAGLERLEREWSDLVGRCATATPFQRPEWLLPWTRRFGAAALSTLVLRRDGDLVGLAPFQLARVDGTRVVSFLGRGITDHLDVVLDDALRREASAAVLAHLAERRDAWDVVSLDELASDSALLEVEAPAGLAREVHDASVAPSLRLPGRVDDLERTMPQSFARDLRRVRGLAARQGGMMFDSAAGADPEPGLEVLFRLHGARWSSLGGHGVLADAEVRAFHLEAARLFRDRGLLRLYTLWIRGDAAAAYYGFLDRGKAYAYLQGFDPRFRPLSAGTQVVGHAIEEAIREGALEFDFLRGTEPYKYRWGARDRVQRQLILRPA
jgi:glycosyltransferase involved in cell wall biosynthesis/CelD/BcsL family acetyltransferase involved in cellulose biosynthesis